MTVRITNEAIDDIVTYYHNARKFLGDSVWPYDRIITYIDKTCDAIRDAAEKLTTGNEPLLDTLNDGKHVEGFSTADKTWYFTAYIDGDEIVVDNAVKSTNMSNQAFRRNKQNHNAPLSRDERFRQKKTLRKKDIGENIMKRRRIIRITESRLRKLIHEAIKEVLVS